MNKLKLNLLATSLFFIVMTSCSQPDSLPPTVLPTPNQAMVTSLFGEAFVFKADNWVEILPGDLLAQGDLVRVMARSSLEIQFGTTAVLRIQEKTLIKINLIDLKAESAKIETELSGGQILAKVNQLVGGTDLRVRTGAISMGVRGTEFLVRNLSGKVETAVSSGKVEWTGPQGNLLVEAGQQASAAIEQTETPLPEDLSQTNREALAMTSQMNFLPFDEETLILVRFLVRTLPPDADIVMGDRIMGRGTWGGVIKSGNELELRVEKGGYATQSLTVKAEEGINPVYLVELEPLAPDTILESSLQNGPTPEELLRLQEATLVALQTRTQAIEGELNSAARKEEVLNTRLAELSAEGADLSRRLSKESSDRMALERQLSSVTTQRDQIQRDIEQTRRQLTSSQTQLESVISAREAEQKATNELIRQLREQTAVPAQPASP